MGFLQRMRGCRGRRRWLRRCCRRCRLRRQHRRPSSLGIGSIGSMDLAGSSPDHAASIASHPPSLPASVRCDGATARRAPRFLAFPSPFRCAAQPARFVSSVANMPASPTTFGSGFERAQDKDAYDDECFVQCCTNLSTSKLQTTPASTWTLTGSDRPPFDFAVM
jgi:hypothetical protein